MELRVALHVPGRRMTVNWTKVFRNLNLTLGSDVLEVLVAEHDELALGHEQSKFV